MKILKLIRLRLLSFEPKFPIARKTTFYSYLTNIWWSWVGSKSPNFDQFLIQIFLRENKLEVFYILNWPIQI